MICLLCYHWASGAYLSGYAPDADFATLMKELTEQYGPPIRIERSAHSEH